MSEWRTLLGQYAKAYEHDGPGPQNFFMLAQDAVDVLADNPSDLLVTDKQSAAAIGVIAALMDVRAAVDALTGAVRELTEEVGELRGP